MLHPKKYQTKPTVDDIRFNINKEIIKNPVHIAIHELAKALSKGQTVVSGYFEKDGEGYIHRRETHWKHQQFVALDFDNEIEVKDAEGKKVKIKHIEATIDDVLHNEFVKKYAAFVYETFSNKPDHPKFRVVFIFDKPFYSLRDCKNTIINLHDLFPMSDKACKDGTRLFFGGNNLHVINYNNRLPNETTLWGDIKGIKPICPPKGYARISLDNTSKLNNSNSIQISNNNKVSNSNESVSILNNDKLASNVQLIRQWDVQSLVSVIKPKPIILYNYHDVYNYLKKQDLKLFLGVNSNSIYDIFHEETVPSGSVFQSQSGNGHWLYRCHSTSSNFAGTIFQITEKLTGNSFVDVRNFLMDVYRITIQENETQKRLREEIDSYKYVLQSEEFPDMFPNTYKLFKRYGFFEDLYILLDLIKENLPADSDDPRLLFYHSINTLAKRLMRSSTNTGIRMNFLTFFKMIYKLDESEVPEKLLHMQLVNKKNNKHRYMNSTYELKTYNYDFFFELDGLCDEWLAKGLTTKSMNYEGILRNFGREEADRVFPQDKGKEVSELHEDIVSMIERETMKLVNKRGWATEKEILENVKLYFKGQKRLKESLMKRCIGEMLDKYDLERIATNKNVKKEMNITDDVLPVASFPKLIRKKVS
ncbi:hypothetical protein [Sutcliffiella sp. NC1]|uniref:hypothetical protein n=1 Tax=Sutcliffiella sp. NC1 TaxID=3004096 RepID=UPI0022DE0E64|nr:hypothetical protein [Sutcliffiella sp. NC1]WBL16346.1 hypothetical protein O1A01_06860 [Sutcliffiella sp. NC1]